MNVQKLIELLSNEDPQAEVALALQPAYPREHRLAGVVSDSAIVTAEQEISDESRVCARTPRAVVYLVEGAWSGYGPFAAWDAAAIRGRA